MALRWDLMILVTLVAALSQSLDRATRASTEAWGAADQLRRDLLLDPERAVRGFCAAAAAAAARAAPGPCAAQLRWRRDSVFVDVCTDAGGLAMPPTSRPSGPDGSAPFRPHRYYDLQTRCLWRVGPWQLALPLLRARVFR